MNDSFIILFLSSWSLSRRKNTEHDENVFGGHYI
jgi:hypothetical protein